MKKLLFIIPLLVLLAGCGESGGGTPTTTPTGGGGGGATKSVTLTWTAPNKNANGTAITGPIGYTVYYGAATKDYTAFADASAAVCAGPPGAIECTFTFTVSNSIGFFTVTAYNASGEESDFSNEVLK